MTTLVWDGRTLSSDAPIVVLFNDQHVTMEPGTAMAVGDMAAAALGALACGATSGVALEAAGTATAAMSVVQPPVNEPPLIHEVQGHGESTQDAQPAGDSDASGGTTNRPGASGDSAASGGDGFPYS